MQLGAITGGRRPPGLHKAPASEQAIRPALKETWQLNLIAGSLILFGILILILIECECECECECACVRED